MAMSSIQEIEHAIRELSPEELATFRAWFAEFDAGVWDRQFEQDVAAGRLNTLADEALREFVDQKVKAGGYGTASEYIRELIHQDQKLEEEQERLEALLLEGLDSGPGIEVTPELWKELRAELVGRRSKAKQA